MKNITTFKKIVTLFLLLFIFSGGHVLPSDSYDTVVRVAIGKGIKEARISIKSPYKIYTLYTHQLLDDGERLRSSRIVPTYNGIKIGDREYKVFGIRIVCDKSGRIVINKRPFRGTVDLIRQNDLTLLIVNHIDVDEYLYGVLYHEVAPWWHYEALKAQAIAARTYALYLKSVRKDKDFDLTRDVYSQLYGGKVSERYRTTKAVEMTKGQVLTYKDRLFPSFYHATCAGSTEPAVHLWNIDIPPLQGNVECPYCRMSPHDKWYKRISKRMIEDKLRKRGFNFSKIDDVRVEGQYPSKRVTEISFWEDGRQIERMKANEFRLLIGADAIRSTNFRIVNRGDYFEFFGRGWGHGVGMCQWGAYGMAKKGFKADEILKFYYPETEVKKIY